MSDTHARVEAAIKAFARGEIVVVTDDDDRENEGDLFVAASLCTPEKLAFILRHTSGLVCAPLGTRSARMPKSSRTAAVASPIAATLTPLNARASSPTSSSFSRTALTALALVKATHA